MCSGSGAPGRYAQGTQWKLEQYKAEAIKGACLGARNEFRLAEESLLEAYERGSQHESELGEVVLMARMAIVREYQRCQCRKVMRKWIGSKCKVHDL